METDLDSLLETYISDLRPEISGAPWIMLNMISSKNGLATLNGTSGALGGPADKALFRTLRGLADVILDEMDLYLRQLFFFLTFLIILKTSNSIL